MKVKLKKGDEVKIVAGKDKGKKGNILKIMSSTAKNGNKVLTRVVVEGVNLVKKHVKRTQQQAGEIVTKEAPLDISNVRIFNSMTAKVDKVAYKVLENGKKVRVFRSNGEVIDV